MKVFRYIALLLLISFSAFLGHNVVPHHHHAEAFCNPIATDCPIQHEDQSSCDQDAEREDHHSDEHPIHCHAFNDLVFEKYNTQVVSPLREHSKIMALFHSELLSDTPLVEDYYSFKDRKIPIKTIELQGSRDLRGPPRSA